MKEWIFKGNSRPINTHRQPASNKKDLRFHTDTKIKTKLTLTIPPTRHKFINKASSAIFNGQGYSLIELIVVIAGLAVLTSIASTTLTSILSDFENDEVQAHLNSLAADCLRIHTNLGDSKDPMQAPTSIDRNLIDKSTPVDVSVEYKEKSDNTCKYFQINPKDSTSKTHFSMGFGISYGKVTKFAIVDEASNLDDDEETDIEIACKGWAGDGNCLANGSDYSAFFAHMDDVRIARATCNINLKDYIVTNPNPSNGGNKKSWDSNADKDCKNKTLPANASSYSTDCATSGCNTKAVKIKDGKIVGVGDNASDSYDEYVESGESQACDKDISDFLKDSYTEPTESFTSSNCKDNDGNAAKVYLCDESQMNKSSYDKCYMNTQIYACNVSLDEIRNESNGEYTVSGKGLPPCGQKVWVCNNIIYDTKEAYNTACSP